MSDGSTGDGPVEAGPTTTPEPYPSTRISWYAVSVLLIAYTIAFIDRTILALMVGPIQRDLGISDTAMGLLHGIAFALFYCLLGIPIARLSDRYSRRWIIVIGMTVWSIMTALCGMAKSFLQLFLARVGVGVGEATLSPAAYSMIADLFPPRQLGRALGVYSSGVFFGAGIAFIVGGTVVSAVQSLGPVHWPLIGEIRAWQAVFFIVGLPGVLFALLVLTVPEPKRRRPPATAAANNGLVQYLRDNKRVVMGHFLGFSALGVIFNGFIAWAPTQLIRDFGVDASQAGAALGIGIFIFGGVGIIAGGMIADRFARAGKDDANLRAGVIGGIGLIPCSVLAPLMPSFGSGAAVYALFFFFASFPFGAAAAALQIMTPPNLRAQVSAIYLLVLNLLGIGLGPLLVAGMSDYLLGGKESIGLAMAITGGVMAPLGALVLFMSFASYRRLVASHR
ncbi:MAG: MFS transporter [Pseudomonadota bacterium]